jgi:Protein of unknown function (DUF3592)
MAIDRPAGDPAQLEASLPGSVLAELRALLAQNRPIEAIRRYSLATGADPTAAKAAIDRIGRAGARVSVGGAVRLFAAFFWLCAILAAIAAGWQAHDRRVVNDTWPRIDAEIVKCSVVAHTSTTRNPPFSTLACQFRYNLHDVEYTARTGSTGIPSAEQEAAMHAWVAHHRPGSRQVIHYDPADPRSISLGNADAAFQADTPALRLRVAALFAGGGLLFLALAACLAARQRQRSAASLNQEG